MTHLFVCLLVFDMKSLAVTQAGVCSGVISAHCNLCLPGPGSSNSPASASRVAEIIGTRHHAQLTLNFFFLVEIGFCCVAQPDLKLLGSSDHPLSACQSARIIGMSHCTQPYMMFKSMRLDEIPGGVIQMKKRTKD